MRVESLAGGSVGVCSGIASVGEGSVSWEIHASCGCFPRYILSTPCEDRVADAF